VLVVSRKENESIKIEPVDGLDPALTLREAFASGAIIVRLQHVGHRRVRLIIEAPPVLRIMRSDAPSGDRGGAADERGLPQPLARGGRG
jgi:sRNA-binding carbon storage regulator CsrA